MEVHDPDPTPPERRWTGDEEESGRGLHLVWSLSERWGTLPAPGGKLVYAEIAATG